MHSFYEFSGDKIFKSTLQLTNLTVIPKNTQNYKVISNTPKANYVMGKDSAK